MYLDDHLCSIAAPALARIHFILNLMKYDRDDGFLFDFDRNVIAFGLNLKRKMIIIVVKCLFNFKSNGIPFGLNRH